MRQVRGATACAAVVLLLLLATGSVLVRWAARASEGDLNLLDERPGLFPGVSSRTDLVVWTIVVVSCLLVAVVGTSLLVRSGLARRNPPRPPRRDHPGADVDHSAGVGAGITVTTVGVLLVLLTRRFTVDGRSYWSLADDQMVSMRFAYNLVHGNDLGWNPGERVEGFTNAGWTLVMAAVHVVVPGTAWPSFWVLMLSCGALGVTAWAVTRLQQRSWSVPPLPAAAGAVLACLLPTLLVPSVLGSELAPMAATLAVAVGAAAGDVRSSRLRGTTVLLFALVTVWRADAVCTAALTGVAAALLSAPAPRAAVLPVVRMLAGVGAAALAQAGSAWLYYGSPIPNTVILRMVGLPHRLEAGTASAVLAALSVLPLVAGVVILVRHRVERSELLVLLPAAAALPVAVAVATDLQPHAGVLAVHVPLVVAVLWARLLRECATASHPVAMLVSIGLASVLLVPDVVPSVVDLRDGADQAGELSRITTAVRLRDEVAPDQRIAALDIGQVAYFSGLDAVDLLGRTDPFLARSTARTLVPGRNKYDVQFSLGKHRPDLVLTPTPVLPDDDSMRFYALAGDPSVTALWRSDQFVTSCAANAVPGLPGVFRCVYS